MPNVEFKVKNKTYNISCHEGEEEHILNLAESLNIRVNQTAEAFASASDGFIMAVTALMMEDEIKGLKENNNNAPDTKDEAAAEDRIDEALANAINPISEYIETLANRLEKR